MRFFSSVVLAAALAAAACGGKQPAPPATPVENQPPAEAPPPAGASAADEAGAQALAVADKLARAIHDGGDDCAKMGANLNALSEEVAAAVATEKKLEADPAQKQAFTDKYDPQLEAKLKDAMPKLEKCMSDPAVKGFIEKLAAD
jgi:hypothetical protein